MMKICQKVHGYVCKRLAKFQQNLSVESFFTKSQSSSMKTSFMLVSALSGITHYVRSIPGASIYLPNNFELHWTISVGDIAKDRGTTNVVSTPG